MMKNIKCHLGTSVYFKNLYDKGLLLKSACLESLAQWAQINDVFIKCFIYKYRLHTKHALKNYILDVSVCPNKRGMHNNTLTF